MVKQVLRSQLAGISSCRFLGRLEARSHGPPFPYTLDSPVTTPLPEARAAKRCSSPSTCTLWHSEKRVALVKAAITKGTRGM